MKILAKFAILAIAATAFATAADSPAARTLDMNNPEDALEVSKRVHCGKGEDMAVYHWSGKIYSRVRGEKDRHLFNGQGMNVRRCVRISDPERGEGYRMVSREVMFYLDPKTNEVLRTWKNPWTDEEVPVMQIANDPVNGRYNYPYSEDGKPFSNPYMRRHGDWMFLSIAVPLFYPNVLAGDYQEYVGNQYHAMEVFNFSMLASEILDSETEIVYPSISWVRISTWMPWMKMRDRQGQMVFNAMGTKLKSYDELPDVIKDEIALNYPHYTEPPPADDTRRNDTTWTVFKRMVDEQREAEKAKGKQTEQSSH